MPACHTGPGWGIQKYSVGKLTIFRLRLTVLQNDFHNVLEHSFFVQGLTAKLSPPYQI